MSAQQELQPERRSNFDRFSEDAKRAISSAQEEALRLNHHYISTEHLLLGLTNEPSIKDILARFDIEYPNKIRSAVEFIVGRGETPVTHEIGLTPRAKKAIEITVQVANRANQINITSKHLLKGVLLEGEGVAAGVLNSFGITIAKLNTATMPGELNKFTITAQELRVDLKSEEAFRIASELDDTLSEIDPKTKALLINTIRGTIELARRKPEQPKQEI